ncbi:MAG: universal stress protein [Thermoplasmatales archaeon]
MAGKSSEIKEGMTKSGIANDRIKSIKVLVPTKCRDATINDIFSFLKLLRGNVNVDLFHVVPITPSELCDCVDVNDVHYDRAVAEKKLYSFMRRFPKASNISYSYKIEEGDPKRAIEKLAKEKSYDLLLLEIGEFCHFSNSVFDVTEVISSVSIPVITFRSPLDIGEIKVGETMSGVTV